MNTTISGSLPIISVIIVAHESRADIVSCLASLQRAASDVPAEIILVDSGSTDDTVRVASETGVPAQILSLRNVGFAAAANAGSWAASGSLLFFLNPDTVVEEGALRALVEAFRDARVQVVGGTLHDVAGTPERWQNIPFPSLRNILANHLGVWWYRKGAFPMPHGPCPMAHSVPWISGAALAIRRETFERLGGFDEKFFLYFEDVDFCWRVREGGGWVLLHPGVRVLHHRGKSAEQGERIRTYDRSQDLFFSVREGLWKRAVVRILRSLVRRRVVLMGVLSVSLPVALLSGRGDTPWGLLMSILTFSLMTVMARAPRVGVLLLVGSLLVGQSWRIPLGELGVTVTDLVLPLVLLAGYFSLVRQRRLGSLLHALAAGWWIPGALLPGLLLAAERLALSDLSVTLGYALRAGAVLLLIPMLRALRVSARFTHMLLIGAAGLLAVIGFLQLWALPVLPPGQETWASQLFLHWSQGGWDPHRYRLVATWLDPNFLGGFFVIALALILGHLSAIRRRRRPTPYPFPPPPYVLLPTTVLLLVALVLTQSRTAMVALIGVMVAFAIMGSFRRVLFPLVTGVALALLVVPSLGSRLLASPWDDPTVQLRLHSFAQAVRHVERFPTFGVGYNAYAFEQLATGNIQDLSLHSRAGADNAIVTMLATTGLWGTLLFLGGILWTLRALLIRSRHGDGAALGVLLAFLGILVHTQFVQSLTYVHLLVPLALLLGSVGNERWEMRDREIAAV